VLAGACELDEIHVVVVVDDDLLDNEGIAIDAELLAGAERSVFGFGMSTPYGFISPGAIKIAGRITTTHGGRRTSSRPSSHFTSELHASGAAAASSAEGTW
jgi:hypothetical protein